MPVRRLLKLAATVAVAVLGGAPGSAHASDAGWAACAPGDCLVTFWNTGTGTGSITATSDRNETLTCRPRPHCAYLFYGLSIVVTAQADDGSDFTGWDNCPHPMGPQCVLDLNRWDAACAIFDRVGTTSAAKGCPPPVPPSPQPLPDTSPPSTRITSAPGRSRSRRAAFRFSSNEPAAKFICKRDTGPWLPCRSPRTYTRLRPGLHAFRVRAIDVAGNIDPTPAAKRWRILR